MYDVYAVVKLDVAAGKAQQGMVFDSRELAQEWIDMQSDKDSLSISTLPVHSRLFETTGRTFKEIQQTAIDKLDVFEREVLGL